MVLCHSIDTLAMMYFDDELVAEERRELELHLLHCASCKARIEAERADLELVRNALIPPPAPELLGGRIAQALDLEDDRALFATRRRVYTWLARGAAAVALAAVAVFALLGPLAKHEAEKLPEEILRQHERSWPLEAHGASAEPFVRRYFKAIPIPVFDDPRIEFVGARLADIGGHGACELEYRITIGDNRLPLTTYVIDGIRSGQLARGRAFMVGGEILHLVSIDGIPAVTFVDEPLGYLFTSSRLTPRELMDVVATVDLVTRADHGR